jgi:hypothetical protein
MLEFGEFVYAIAQVGFEVDSKRNAQIFENERKSGGLPRAEMSEGLIRWTWERGDVKPDEIIESGRCWTLHLPLSIASTGWGYLTLYRIFDNDHLMLDINYLCHLFQRQMSLAVERVLKSGNEEPISGELSQAVASQN